MSGVFVLYSFNKRFSMAAFVDIGETFAAKYPTPTWPMHYSVGGSARLITDFGVLSFSWFGNVCVIPTSFSFSLINKLTPLCGSVKINRI